MEHYSEDPHINIGAGKDYTIRELAEIVREVVYPEATLVFDADKPDGTPQKLLDVHRLQQMGWKFKINLREGISSTYAWYLKQGKGN
jgi:GDP-L-fucose synthase